MSTRLDSNDAFDRLTGDDNLDQAKQVSAMAAAFAEAVPLGPKVLGLQRALVAGMEYSQDREAKRLARRLDKSDPRLATAVERARVFAALAATAEAMLAEATRVAASASAKPGLQGYVSHADGTTAQRHIVQLAWAGELKQGTTLEATTDERGYFSIELGSTGLAEYRRMAAAKVATAPAGAASTGAAPGATAPASATTAAAGTAPGGVAGAGAGAAKPADSQNDGASGSANSAPGPGVRVLNPNRTEVFRDPLPPTFESTSAEFRYYVLGMDKGA